jgi:hypothetical protein
MAAKWRSLRPLSAPSGTKMQFYGTLAQYFAMVYIFIGMENIKFAFLFHNESDERDIIHQ